MPSVKIAASSSGDNTIVAAVTGSIIRVLAFVLSGSGAVNAKFQSAASGTDLTGLFYLAANTVVTSPSVPARIGGLSGLPGQFETNAGELLNLNLSAGTAVGGYVVYDIVKV